MTNDLLIPLTDIGLLLILLLIASLVTRTIVFLGKASRLIFRRTTDADGALKIASPGEAGPAQHQSQTRRASLA